MPQNDWFSRLRQARIARVLALYLGASWVVLQLVDVLMGMLSLPEWVGPVAVVLLLIGLVVVSATAMVQALPSTQAAEEAGAVPGDWQVAPGDVLASLRQGRLPHLTWGRAILGGVVAMSLLFGAAGAYVLLTGRPLPLSPAPAGASIAATGLAVLPFDVSGAESDLLTEGIVDLLSKGLDGTGELRAIDSRTVLSRWDRMVDADATADLDVALRVAGATGARYAVWGSGVATGAQIRLSADIYDLDSREKVGQASVEGDPDNLLSLVDYLAVEVRRALIGGQEGADLAVGRVENLTTQSLPALRAYLEGAGYYRRADFPAAAESFELAIREDSAFALAYYRLSAAYGSMEIGGTPEARNVQRMLDLLESDLPARARRLLEGGRRWGFGAPGTLAYLQQSVDLYPDDPEAWFNLAEFYYHNGPSELLTLEETEEVWLRALDLDPGFAPTYIHLVQVQLALGKDSEARQNLDRYVQLAPADSHQALALGLSYDLQFGDSAEREAARTAVAEVSDHVAGDTWLGLMGEPASDPAREWVARSHEWDDSLIQELLTQGRIDEAVDLLLEGANLPAAYRVQLAYISSLQLAQPDDRIIEYLNASATPETCGNRRGSGCAVAVGAHLVDSGNLESVEMIVAELRTRAEEMAAGEDLFRQAPSLLASARALDGYMALASGDLATAERLLEGVRGEVTNGSGFRDDLIRIWLGDLMMAADRAEDAVPYYRSFVSTSMRSFGDLRLSEAYSATGEDALARNAAERFLEAWASAPQDRPEVEAARQVVERP